MDGLKRKMRDFHADESGALRMSRSIIVALIVIPLVIALIFLGRKIFVFFGSDDDPAQSGPAYGDPGISAN